jgi:hypothetical protein
MSYPTKRKGVRNIVVEGVRYRWCLRTGVDDSHVTLQGEMSGGQQAIVAVRGMRDPWLGISEGSVDFIKISPKTVRLMIQQALESGWKPSQRRGSLKMDYRRPAEDR